MLRRIRGVPAAVIALGVLAAAVLAATAMAEKPVVVEVGNLRITANGGLTPKALSKTKLTPVTFSAEGKIETKDGTHPPAAQQIIIEGDKNVAVDTTGYPTCKSGKITATDTAHALAACKTALIGEGTTTAEVQFPESKPVLVNSKLLAFNGGTSGGVTTFYIHAYFSAPVSGALVTTVKIKKIHKGRYGTEAVATIPKLAGGSGSVISFSLKIAKQYTYKGKKMSVISAKCTDGKIQAKVTSKFSDGTNAVAEIIRTCTPKG